MEALMDMWHISQSELEEFLESKGLLHFIYRHNFEQLLKRKGIRFKKNSDKSSAQIK
jgi:hypothetical protein